MKIVCFTKQKKEKDSKIFCYPFIVPKNPYGKSAYAVVFLLLKIRRCLNYAIIAP